MNDLEKLRIILPHWIEHNQGHGAEFSQWSKKLEGDYPEISHLLTHAVQALQDAQSALEKAMDMAGGGKIKDGHHHSHHHGKGHHHH